MTTALTILVMVFLTIGAAGLIHRLNAQHAERITLHRYSRFAPGRRGDRDSNAHPVLRKSEPLAVPARRDQRDGGQGHLRLRRRTRHAHGH
ncbi:hypothetical protein ACFH04_03965 [Streptomyces noboritoensis]|uniref:Secreted protein n=1 Tax=Streptomyces noboritoensis TaxID=67337 RepID=A0ABV6TCR8_9ACTN